MIKNMRNWYKKNQERLERKRKTRIKVIKQKEKEERQDSEKTPSLSHLTRMVEIKGKKEKQGYHQIVNSIRSKSGKCTKVLWPGNRGTYEATKHGRL